MRIGVLAVQGDFEAHQKILEEIGVPSVLVRNPADLTGLEGLILPGGESGAHLRIMKENGLYDAVRRFHDSGGALYGTCAGLILLAKRVEEPAQESLGLIDIDVVRNGYGRQIDSFESDANGDPEVTGGKPLRMVFIRAPRITRAGPRVHTLLTHDGEPVAAREGRVLVSTFHPEMAGEPRLHHYFARMIEESTRMSSGVRVDDS
jgi:5'-phosphate synthase pdxT subunit